NGQGEALNRERLISLLADEGFAFEREGSPDEQSVRRIPDELAYGRLLFFKGASKDAIATLSRDGSGQTTMVLNVVTSSEHSR
ncbi:MAG: hypothetical protein M3Y55_15945, partial [Pseudomonadota bacterium]|nr:hypothetical protein [Pseudomonadota bacterium]